MTVKQLIEKLKEYPEDMQVVCGTDQGTFLVRPDEFEVIAMDEQGWYLTDIPEGTTVLSI